MGELSRKCIIPNYKVKTRTSKYNREFKDSTVQLILNNYESITKVAAYLDMNPKIVYSWVNIYKKRAQHINEK